MNEQEFAQRLRQYRKEKGMTQQELADLLGVSNKTVSRWESGSYPDVTTLVALARALGVTVDELLDPKAPVRSLEKSDWQNLLSFAFAIGGGLLFYLLAQFVPVVLCWMLYLGCLAYGIYLQDHYTYHTHWFRLGVWIMALFVSGSVAGMLLTGAMIVVGASSPENLWTSGLSMMLEGGGSGRLAAAVLMWGLIWLVLTAALSWVTVSLARWLAQSSSAGAGNWTVCWKNASRLRLERVPFRWQKAVPALAPLILMGYWCLFWRDDLPDWLYLAQEELYLPVWAAVSLVTLLPLLKKGRRGMLVPAVVLALLDGTFPSLLAYERGVHQISRQVIQLGISQSGNIRPFGQAKEELIIFAVVLSLLYLICCFLRLKAAPRENQERKEKSGYGGDPF